MLFEVGNRVPGKYVPLDVVLSFSAVRAFLKLAEKLSASAVVLLVDVERLSLLVELVAGGARVLARSSYKKVCIIAVIIKIRKQ